MKTEDKDLSMKSDEGETSTSKEESSPVKPDPQPSTSSFPTSPETSQNADPSAKDALFEVNFLFMKNS